MREALHTSSLWVSALLAILAVVVAAMFGGTGKASIAELSALSIPAVSFGLVAWTTRKKLTKLKGTENA